jgi:2-phospho-L-lactate guanylyltransferase
MMNYWAVVPLKSPQHAKSRLAAVLSASQRRKLLFALAQHVVGALRATPGIARVAVVTASEEVARFSAALGAVVLRQSDDAGTAEAFAFGLSQLEIQRPHGVLMVPGDLPLISPLSVRAVLDAAPLTGVVVVPDRRGIGTNMLLCVPPNAIAPAFGADSLRRHLAAAGAAGVPARRLEVEALALDLDEPEDLELLSRSPSPRMAILLQALRIAQAA